MSKTFNNTKDLLKYLQKQANSAMRNDVAKEAVKTLKENIVSEVYDKYEPVKYERQGTRGGLLDDKNIKVGAIDDNTIYIENIRFDGDREVAQIVETGIGYQYPLRPENMRNGWTGGARPFTEKTAEELNDGRAVESLKKGLRKRGLDAR